MLCEATVPATHQKNELLGSNSAHRSLLEIDLSINPKAKQSTSALLSSPITACGALLIEKAHHQCYSSMPACGRKRKIYQAHHQPHIVNIFISVNKSNKIVAQLDKPLLKEPWRFNTMDVKFVQSNTLVQLSMRITSFSAANPHLAQTFRS